MFDTALGWKPNPFLLSKLAFKPPIIDQLAREAGSQGHDANTGVGAFKRFAAGMRRNAMIHTSPMEMLVSFAIAFAAGAASACLVCAYDRWMQGQGRSYSSAIG